MRSTRTQLLHRLRHLPQFLAAGRTETFCWEAEICITASKQQQRQQQQQVEGRQRWCVWQRLGGKQASVLATQFAGRRYRPLAGVALRLDTLSSTGPRPSDGRIFCALPLPTKTGLPVHINGYFEVLSNRRSVWDGMPEGDDIKTRWNHALRDDLIASLYRDLMLDLRTLPREQYDRLWPVSPKDGFTQQLVETFFLQEAWRHPLVPLLAPQALREVDTSAAQQSQWGPLHRVCLNDRRPLTPQLLGLLQWVFATTAAAFAHSRAQPEGLFVGIADLSPAVTARIRTLIHADDLQDLSPELLCTFLSNTQSYGRVQIGGTHLLHEVEQLAPVLQYILAAGPRSVQQLNRLPLCKVESGQVLRFGRTPVVLCSKQEAELVPHSKSLVMSVALLQTEGISQLIHLPDTWLTGLKLAKMGPAILAQLLPQELPSGALPSVDTTQEDVYSIPWSIDSSSRAQLLSVWRYLKQELATLKT